MYLESRQKTYELFAPNLGGRTGLLTDWFIMVLISINVLAVMLETVDVLYENYTLIFHSFEIISVIIFTFEYLTRVWSCIENPNYNGPVSGRLEFATRPLLIIDLLAILPFYLGAMVSADLRFLRALRLIRFFRLFKLARYSDSMVAFAEVAKNKREDLIISFTATGLLWVVSSSIMYFLERNAQPDVFSSIPQTLWWGVITLTTVGYGDTYPVTPFGQVFGAVVAMLGVGLFALPASILAAGFIEHTVGSRTCPHCGEEFEEEY